MTRDVSSQTSACSIHDATCFTCVLFCVITLSISVITFHRFCCDVMTLRFGLTFWKVAVDTVSLQASLHLVSGSTSVTNIRFFYRDVPAFTVLVYLQMFTERIISFETLVAFDTGKRSGRSMHCLMPDEAIELWEPLVTQVAHVACFVLILRWHMAFVLILRWHVVLGLILFAQVMLEKVLVARLKLGLGAEGTSKFCLWFIAICFFIFIWNIKKYIFML